MFVRSWRTAPNTPLSRACRILVCSVTPPCTLSGMCHSDEVNLFARALWNSVPGETSGLLSQEPAHAEVAGERRGGVSRRRPSVKCSISVRIRGLTPPPPPPPPPPPRTGSAVVSRPTPSRSSSVRTGPTMARTKVALPMCCRPSPSQSSHTASRNEWMVTLPAPQRPAIYRRFLVRVGTPATPERDVGTQLDPVQCSWAAE
ncbi:MAG: hypothetical protein ACI841_002367 [Planctomycetota bacterium]